MDKENKSGKIRGVFNLFILKHELRSTFLSSRDQCMTNKKNLF